MDTERTLELNAAQKEATASTTAENARFFSLLDFCDLRELENATKGLIAAPDSLVISDSEGKVVWSQEAYSFLGDGIGVLTEERVPSSVNPSLWKNAQLNHFYGLFEVTDGIYQVRGYDISNITFIRGEVGWIVFDPLVSIECARAAYDLVTEHLGHRPISAVIYSHTHVDHYGGVEGIISADDDVPIIAPEHFVEFAITENLFAGIAMGRRSSYQYGNFLTPDEKGSLSLGIGISTSRGTSSFLPPTDYIKTTGEKRTIDGVIMEFQMTPGTEAPAEMNTYFPQKKALWVAENCSATMHNIFTLRGAQVRDAYAWAKYLMETLDLYPDAQIAFTAHNWPHWGVDDVREYLLNTATINKFIHDQTMMFINQGFTANEISHMIELPDALEKIWYTRQYYGTLSHNSRAIYQKHMGFYDANPVNLNPLTPQWEALKFVEYLGDPAEVLAKAQTDFNKGQYQWVARVTNLLVFADPKNVEARLLCADALEQLGYQSESGPWRCCYLTGALELRHGVNADRGLLVGGAKSSLKYLDAEMLFDYLGILIDANAAQDTDLVVNINFVDPAGAKTEQWTLYLRHGVVLYEKGHAKEADATLTMPRQAFLQLFSKEALANVRGIQIEGDADILTRLTEHLVEFDPFFNIVEP
ncbi:MAG: MBL fold metallo-hydrolase [Coriobacteriia bacterium]|nr:MBL fold metallo-hydrolase [Coriobacteriia bacterium]